jgi:sulfide:quinone oxidoreductase
MRRVLILGGGFGGVATAHTLREKLRPDDEIIVVDRRRHFMVGFRKTWAMLGMASLEDGQRSLSSLEERGIRFVQANITSIDPGSRSAEVGGKLIEADALVVALGARLAPESIPGLKQWALNVYDSQDIPHAAETLRNFSGGRLVVGIFGAPYKCPPAPYEMAMMMREFFQSRNVSADLEVFTPKPMSLPIIGSGGCDVLESHLSAHGVRFLPSHKAIAVEDGEVVFQSGERRKFDLLVGVPPHTCPDVVLESGLTEGADWVPVNPRTLETSVPGVYAIGDCTGIPLADGKQLPKAGIFAELQGKIVAERIAASFDGQKPMATYDGVGYCFLEFGAGTAAYVRGEFYAEPAPKAMLTEISPDHMEAKRSFETDRLKMWFGG